MCRKELITKLHNFVHLNLCIALALGLLLFLTGIQTATANVVRANKHCIQLCSYICMWYAIYYCIILNVL